MNILVVGDTHADRRHTNERFEWIGKYGSDVLNKGDAVVQIGDFGDFRAFGSFDHGKKGHVEESYQADFEVVHEAWETLTSALPDKVDVYVAEGNHEHRVDKAISCDYRLEGLVSPDLFPWRERNMFCRYKEKLNVGGVWFTHCLISSMGRPVGGSARHIFGKFKGSIVVGHSHIWDWHEEPADEKMKFCLVAGNMSHEDHSRESWCIGSSNRWWGGVTVLHDVRDGYPLGGVTREPFENLRKWYS